ncbi:DUF4286 family protein [Pseudomaricurvus hydrocarbonicus]|uniref:DUF4286 family protein n=1 Tax=Pseudomaricurvus hydrocarbonicus TaxID=1470433 RepID=UPI001AA066A0|nr:DUF4286 family protein [Aestuariicella hydrocarbonica]
MPHYKMVVFTRPKAGREQEYNDWYQNVHLRELVAFPGITSAQRFKLSATLGEADAQPYLSIYEIETEDIDSVAQAIQNAAQNHQLTMSDAVDLEFAEANIYQVFGAQVNKPGHIM